MTTAKEKVLAVWPDAYAEQQRQWVIYDGDTANQICVLGSGHTEASAWENAAEGLDNVKGKV
jgi:hypothetical protein